MPGGQQRHPQIAEHERSPHRRRQGVLAQGLAGGAEEGQGLVGDQQLLPPGAPQGIAARPQGAHRLGVGEEHQIIGGAGGVAGDVRAGDPYASAVNERASLPTGHGGPGSIPT
jgi:hypothetical protein